MVRETLLAALQLMHTTGIGNKTFEKLIQQLGTEGKSLTDFVRLPVSEKVSNYGLKADIAEAVSGTYDTASKTADALLEKNILLLLKGMPSYPQKLTQVLGQTAPPFLFVKGNLSILERKGVGFCGSRRASEKGLRVATDCAEDLSKEGINVVSGYAYGVDLATHRGAMRSGGVTTLVLAEGILNFKLKREIAEWFRDDNNVIVSEYPPRLTWVTHNAMQRNRTICGLSDAVIVIESGLKGGTFNAGNQALELKLPLFVAEYATPAESAKGNLYFINKGAIAVRGNRNGKPNLTKVFQAIHVKPKEGEEVTLPDDDNGTSTASIQLPMFGLPDSQRNSKQAVEVDSIPENGQFSSLTWNGDIPHQKWQAFFNCIVAKFLGSSNLKLTVNIEATVANSRLKENIEEIRLMLRELNLDEQIEVK